VKMLILLLVLIIVNISHSQSPGNLVLTVAYCPTEFSGKGAVVEVDPESGSISTIGTFDWPSEVFGCPIEEDPTVTLDGSTLYLYFIDFTLLVVLDLSKGKITNSASPPDPFFTGFENMQWSEDDNQLLGVSATVTEDGLCSDGCFEFGKLSLDGKYTALSNILFKEIADDVSLYDSSSSSFWIQGGYDLRDNPCAPEDSDECLLLIDSTTGNLTQATFTNWTIYNFGFSQQSSTQRLVWMEGFDSVCNDPYNNFLFASVDLNNAIANPLVCIPSTAIIQMDEWISSFSLDGNYFATGSGDAETGTGQLLIFDPSSGKIILQSDLSEIVKLFNPADGLFDIWSVDWI